jgi:SpoVK/Ycf46/Vps4 family AAA+-type ATPase
MGHFKVKKITDLATLNIDDTINEADYTVLSSLGCLVQFEYISEEKEKKRYEVKPGIWKIVKTVAGLSLETTSFVNDQILEEFASSQEIESIIDSFFNNLHLYKEFGIEIPKRNILLYGEPGSGKSTSIAKASRKYAAKGNVCIVTWDTNVLESYEVKYFINSFEYKGVDSIIVIAEDIGGIENEGADMRTDSSLLSLLDNSDKTFTIPVMIISTTNHPANLGSAIANRSGRFDDKIEVGCPPATARVSLLKFFSKDQADEVSLKLIESKACDKFPPAHIREAWIRSKLRNKPLTSVIEEIIKEIALYDKAFEKKRKESMGF